jgi:MraZ protein
MGNYPKLSQPEGIHPGRREMLFTGRYPYTLDERNRVPIPAGFRAAFENGGHITTGAERPCLVLHTYESLSEAAAIIEAIPPDTDLGEQARRDFYGNMLPFKKDPQGRITLTPEHIQYAGIEREVLFVGTGRRVELWDRATYEAGEKARKEARQRAMNQRQNEIFKEE